MGGVTKNIGSTIGRGALAVGTGGLSEFAQKNPFGESIVKNPLALKSPFFQQDYLLGGGSSGGTQDPNANALNLYMNPAGDAAAINGLGQSQYDQSQNLIGQNQATYGTDAASVNSLGQSQYDRNLQQSSDDSATRQAARDKLAGYLQQQAQQTFSQSLPGTAEDYNAGGLLNSTGYQQEVARQQANLAAQVTNQLGQQGVQDMYAQTAQRDAALQGLQGMQQQGLNQTLAGSAYGRQANAANLQSLQGANQQALSRTFNLQDYAREANVAKQIGSQLAPSTKPTKASSSAMGISGLGAGAQAGSLMGGPYGAMAGGVGGGLLGLLGGGGGK